MNEDGKKHVRVSKLATMLNAMWLYLVPNVILYGWIRGDQQLETSLIAQYHHRPNVTRW